MVVAKRLLTDYIATGKSNYIKQDPEDTGLAFSETDHEDDWKKNVSCHGCGLIGHQLKECNKTSPEDKRRSTP